jgi:hypothetical protein
MTPGQTVTVTASFDIDLVGEDGGYEVNEIVVGSKYQPEPEEGEAPAKSFVGQGRIQVSTSPYTEITTQYQATVWTVDAETQELHALTITEYDLVANESGIVAEFSFIAPEYSVDKIHISHDLRGYVWEDYETACEDLSDNDNDGLVDCDDPDCDGHPGCDDEDDDDSADDDDDSSSADDDDDDDDDDDTAPADDNGCSCSLQSRGAGLLGLALLIPLFGMFRRGRKRRTE